MKKNLLWSLAMAGAFGLNAQTYQDITPACFEQNVENECASACGDFNGDGYLDIVLTGKAAGVDKTWLYLNDGQGGFTLAENTGLDKGFIHSSIAVGDYDGDGDLDLAIQGWVTENGKDTQYAYVYQNNGQGVFTQAAALDGRSNGVIEFGDYDNDGKMDVLQVGHKDGLGAKVTIWHNDGNNAFTDINNTTLFPMSDGEARFGDYDNDGNLDILLNGWQQAHVYKGDGKGGFTKQTDIALTGYGQSFAYWVDYDRDGNLDILLGGLKEGAFFTDVWKGNGTNAFTKVDLGLPGVQVGPIRTGDCDHDGYTDFFISGWNGAGTFAVYKNDGMNTAFTPVAGVNDVIPGWADGTLEVADFDGDGYAEIFKCGWKATKLYRNTDRPAEGQALTQTLYLDFGKSDGTNGNITAEADANGHYWNNIVSDESGAPSRKPAGYTVDLVNADNQATGITLETVEDFMANGKKNGALLAPNPDLLGDLAVATATEDYFFIDNGVADKGAFVLKGLNPQRAYKFYVFGSRSGNDVRTSIFSITGRNGSHGTHQTTGAGIGTDIGNTNDDDIWESGYVMPKDNGEILFELGILTGGFAYINAMKIEEYEGYTLPVADRQFYIDFGKNNNGTDGAPTASPDVNGHYWNNMYSNGDGPTTEQAGLKIDIVYSDNTETPYEVELADKFEFNGVRNGGLTNPDPALLGDLAIATATQDYIFRSGDGTTASILFKNLDKEKMYRFHIFGSRLQETGNRIGIVQLTGSNSVTGIHQMGGKDMAGTGVHRNVANIFVSDLLVPDTEGTITLKLTEWLGNFFHVNAMKVEELDVTDQATALAITGSDAIDVCGQTLQLSATATPEGAFCPAVTWTVSDDELAQITENGLLYPLGNGTVTVTATATFASGSQLTDSKEITLSNQTPDDYTLTVMGSSVPYGQGADTGKGYAQLWANYLATEAEHAWSTDNISVPGNNTTDVMNRWDSDLLPTCSRYVYYGLSLGNEGVHENGQTAFDSYRDNMQTIIERTRLFGKVPLMGNNYARADFNESDYNFVKQLNLLIHEWDVPSVNLLGAIDNGAGQWATGYQADNAHPNTAGHAEMFYAFVPSLLDALVVGKPQPVRQEGTSLSLGVQDGQAQLVTWQPEGTLHPFTVTFSFRTESAGTLLRFAARNGSLVGKVMLAADGTLTYDATQDDQVVTASGTLNDGEWHTVSLTHYFARQATLLYVDGVLQGEVKERLYSTTFSLNAADNPLTAADFRELYFHRAGMCAEEIAALHEGRMLKSSLEIYAPLDGTASGEGIVENKAQSLNKLVLEENRVSTGLDGVQANARLKEVTVYKVTGEKLMTLQGDNWEKDGLNNLPSGIYVLRMVDENGNIATRKAVGGEQ